MASAKTSVSNWEPCQEYHLAGHRKAITYVRFSPTNNDLVATSSMDKTVFLWNLKQKTRALHFTAHNDVVSCLSWSPTGKFIASACYDHKIKIWEPKHKSKSWEIFAHTKPVRSVDFDATGKFLLSASNDKSVKLWKMGSFKFLSGLRSHAGWVRSAKFNVYGQEAATCCEDKKLRIFDIQSNELLCMFEESGNGTPMQCAWHPTGNLIAVALSNKRVKIYDIRSKELTQLYEVHAASVNDLCFDSSGKILLTGSDDGTIKVLDLLEGRPIFTLTGHMAGVKAVAFSADATKFASAGEDQQLLIWNSNMQVNEEAEKVSVVEKFEAKPENIIHSDVDDEASTSSTSKLLTKDLKNLRIGALSTVNSKQGAAVKKEIENDINLKNINTE